MKTQAQRGEVLGQGHRANKSINMGHDLGVLTPHWMFVLLPYIKDDDVMFWRLAVKKVLQVSKGLEFALRGKVGKNHI